jgi:hypothetical protein
VLKIRESKNYRIPLLNGVGGAVFSPFAGIILCRLSGIISAFFVTFRQTHCYKKSTPEIQTVKRTLEYKGRGEFEIFFKNFVTKVNASTYN